MVTISVTDVNDNTPVLTADIYNLTISEATSIGSLHDISISTSDRDSGINSQIRYTLEGTSMLPATSPSCIDDILPLGVFSIGQVTGVLTLESSLDYESSHYLTFTVVAADSGVPSRNDTALVSVTITDANDNYPVFTTIPANMELSVYEANYSKLELFGVSQ